MKILRYSIAVLFFLLLLVSGLVLVKIDTIIHQAINTYGSQLLGVNVNIKKVNVDFMNSNITIYDLSVKNPVGFSNRDALYIPKINIKSKISNLTQHPIIIEDIIANSPTVNFELTAKDNNISALKRHLMAKKSSSPSHHKASSSSETNPYPFVFQHILISDIKLNAELQITQKTVDLGDISILGTKHNKPIPYEDIVQQVLDQLTTRILKNQHFNVNIAGVNINLLKSPKEIKEEVHNELQHYLKNTLNKLITP